VLVRHAISVPPEEFSGRDAERPLTARGRERGDAVMARLAKWARPTRLVSSPYRRAAETAELFRAHLDDPPALATTNALVPDATWEAWTAYLAAAHYGRDDVLVAFGHEPSIGEIAARHLGLPAGSVPFKKAGFVVLRPRTLLTAELLAFVPPRMTLG
jgi:phosphohistidine phosphatase SixA